MIPDALAKRNHFKVFKFHGKASCKPSFTSPWVSITASEAIQWVPAASYARV